MMTQAAGIVLIDSPFNRVRFHQTNRPQWQSDTVLQDSTLKKIKLQATAAQIKNQPRLQAIPQCILHRRAHQPRLFFAADHFEFDSPFAADSLHQPAVIPGFAGSSSGDGAIGRNVVAVHAAAKLTKRPGGSCNRFFVEQAVREGVVPQANSGPFAIENLDVIRRSGSSNRESNGIRASVDRSQLDGGGHY